MIIFFLISNNQPALGSSNGQSEEYAQALEKEKELQAQLRTYENELTQKEIKIQRIQEAYAEVCTFKFSFVSYKVEFQFTL